MRYVRQAGDDPAFLLKALSEASGELRRTFHGVSRPTLLQAGDGFDEPWCLLAIAYHIRETERGVVEQVQAMLDRREPEIKPVDFDDIPFREDYQGADDEALLDEFHWLRQRLANSLWDHDERQWQRGGIHPYRGRLTVLQVAREVYQHDLEHLWQAQRMIERMGVRA